MRRTASLAAVCTALLDRRKERQWGYDIGRRAGVPSGVLYPMLTRLVAAGWLTSAWDDRPDSGPRRRYYEVTDEGARAMREIVKR